MKKKILHRFLPSCIVLLLSFFLPGFANAQSGCRVTITSDFEPRCLVTTDKPLPFEELEGELIACQGMTVKYTALTNTGSNPVVSWIWSVTGASTWTDLGLGRIRVTWDNGTIGQISVTVTTDAGTSCTVTRIVRLIEKPSVAAATVPAYQIDANGDKVIYVCGGADIDFIDQTHSGDNDITGYYWESLTSSSTLRNFTLRNVLADDQVVHRVYNECGCYDEEIFNIVVLQGDILELECYGTACQNDIVRYVVHHLGCDSYYWGVDGGTIVDGQHNDTLTIQWNRPRDGYGIISLDGVLCGNYACPAMLSKKIPVMHDSVPVDGKTEVCVGEGVVYSVPLFGSTEYHWVVTPSNGVDVSDINGANKIHVEFLNQGTYTIRAIYKCDFLNCGPYNSKVLTVTVKPPLTITGRNKICSGNSCHLTTDAGVAAQWKVYDMATGQQVASSASAQVFFDRTFPNTGQYRIVAEHSSYCAPGEFILSVLDPPPAPVVGDLDPSNPTIACKGSSINLKATPSNPAYSIVWKPLCSSAQPQTVSGDDVTISYGSDVCGVKIYNYDRTLECLSTGYYTHPVTQFTLLPLTLSSYITVCPGAEIVFDNNNVPYQDGVLYRWTIEDDKQYCATVVGSALTNTVRIQVNDILPPDAFEITLTRRYCSGEEEVFTITVSVGEAVLSQLSINDIAPVCVGDQVTLSGSGCYYSYPRWEVDGVRLLSSIYVAESPGEKRVKMICNPFSFCSDESYYSVVTSSFRVNSQPYVRELVYNNNNTVGCRPNGNNPTYSYSWSFGGNVISTNNTAPYQGEGSYTLVLTDNTTGCETTFVQYVDNFHYQNDNCSGMTLTGESFDYCSRRYTINVADPHNQTVHWTLEGGSYSDGQTSYSRNEHFEAILNSVGTYVITAYTEGDPCYRVEKTFTIDFIPDFSFEQQCDAIVIHNNSKYLDGTKTVTLRCGIQDYTFPLSEQSYTITGLVQAGHGISLMEYNGISINWPSGCFLGLYYNYVTPHTLSITTANVNNQTQTCDNTPILLTAEMSDQSSIQSTYWDFGDGSTITRDGGEVYHTFSEKKDPLTQLPIPYIVSATVKDEIGCDVTGSISITSFKDDIRTGEIDFDYNNSICPNTTPVELSYTGSPATPASYNWSYPDGHNYNYYVYYTDNYYLYLEDAHYCKAEDRKNVGFLNTTQANIATERNEYCVGETIALFGAPDPDTTNYTFLWTITAPNNTVVTRNTATAFFTANQTGSYTVRLDISNGNCSDYDVRTIPVGNVPPAPTVAFGANQCIDAPPVDLTGSALATNTMCWSNGNYRHNARYFTPGFATAFYYDPATGCKSESGGILIEEQPDFDGLLTGCYWQCTEYMTNLPVYGLTTETRTISYAWYNNNSIVTQSNNVNYIAPLMLPLPNYGDYNLSVDYQGNACTVVSPTLTLNVTDYCGCDTFELKTVVTPIVHNCIVRLGIDVTIVNPSHTAMNLSSLTALFDNTVAVITGTTFTPQTVAPNGQYSFSITVLVNQFLPSGLKFRVFDAIGTCNIDFVIDLMECVNCTGDMNMYFKVNKDLSNNAAAYLDFFANISPVHSLLAFWSEPPMVIDYLFNNINTVSGLSMIDMALLSQLAEADSMICFYAIVCYMDNLCKYKCCIKAKDIVDMLIDAGLFDKSAEKNDAEIPNNASPYLAPNPTSNIVSVFGYEGNIVDIIVMDMNGRKVAIYTDLDVFDISSMSSGTYIVRVRSKDNEDKEGVCYLKLIKK